MLNLYPSMKINNNLVNIKAQNEECPIHSLDSFVFEFNLIDTKKYECFDFLKKK